MNLDDYAELAPELPEAGLLYRYEELCPECRYTFHRALPECPTCKDLR